MNDLILFLLGCFVSLVILSAVGLLMWGAANEPRGSLLSRRSGSSPPPRTLRPTELRPTRKPERIAG